MCALEREIADFNRRTKYGKHASADEQQANDERLQRWDRLKEQRDRTKLGALALA
jgi:hypothetical protein